MKVTNTVIAQMKRDYLAGLSQGDIAKKYTALGYVTTRGLRLHQAAISVFLRSKATTVRKVSTVKKVESNHSLYLGIPKASGVDATKKVNTLISLME
jgi:hypothetical protein